jgi:hypothetical protein
LRYFLHKDEIFEQGQFILKQCETSPDEINICLWTIIVKALVLSRPSVIEQYLPRVEFNVEFLEYSTF